MKKLITLLTFFWLSSLCIFPAYAKDATPSNAEKYAEEYQSVLDEVADDGVSMTLGNTKSELKDYFESIAPSHNEDISFEVVITDNEHGGPGEFVPAIAGTRDNPLGTRGRGGVRVFIESSADDSTDMADMLFLIIPTQYENISQGKSEKSSDSERDISLKTNYGLSITNPSVYEGIWELCGGQWKIKKSDGSYANTQWAFIQGKWYLFGTDNYMMTDWQLVNGKWYHLSPNGDMSTGWLLKNGNWYWFEPTGEMVTGWKWIDGKCYYFDSSGAMWYGTTTPDGYQVDANGAWI